MSLLDAKPIYKPFNCPLDYGVWLKQQQISWLSEEVFDNIDEDRNKMLAV